MEPKCCPECGSEDIKKLKLADAIICYKCHKIVLLKDEHT